MHNPHHARQLTGAITAQSLASPSGPLDVDPNQTGINSNIAVPTLTVHTTAPPSSTITPSATAQPSQNSDNGKRLGTGVIIGVIVGIFAALAIALVIFMSIRHKRRLQAAAARRGTGTRKSWSRLPEGGEKVQMQMRAPEPNKDSMVSNDESFLSLNSSRAMIIQKELAQPAPPNRNPFLPPVAQETQPPEQQQKQRTPEPSATSTETHNTIPNPFSSPPTSPSYLSHSSHHSGDTIYSNTLDETHLTHETYLAPALTPQYDHAHASVMTASSASTYPDFPEPPTHSHIEDQYAKLIRKPTARTAERSKELKAMQDLISALDENPPPSAFNSKSLNLTVDTSSTGGRSRLSMGEGLVTPGGRSLLEEDAVLSYDAQGNPIWSRASEIEHNSLPRAELPRATVAAGAEEDEARRSPKHDKGKGKAVDPNH